MQATLDHSPRRSHKSVRPKHDRTVRIPLRSTACIVQRLWRCLGCSFAKCETLGEDLSFICSLLEAILLRSRGATLADLPSSFSVQVSDGSTASADEGLQNPLVLCALLPSVWPSLVREAKALHGWARNLATSPAVFWRIFWAETATSNWQAVHALTIKGGPVGESTLYYYCHLQILYSTIYQSCWILEFALQHCQLCCGWRLESTGNQHLIFATRKLLAGCEGEVLHGLVTTF